jgi:hypothetical protein
MGVSDECMLLDQHFVVSLLADRSCVYKVAFEINPIPGPSHCKGEGWRRSRRERVGKEDANICAQTCDGPIFPSTGSGNVLLSGLRANGGSRQFRFASRVMSSTGAAVGKGLIRSVRTSNEKTPRGSFSTGAKVRAGSFKFQLTLVKIWSDYSALVIMTVPSATSLPSKKTV